MRKLRPPASPRLSPEVIRAVHRQGFPASEQLVTNATVNLPDSNGRSVLSLVVNYGDAAMLQWLLTKGPALDRQDRNGWTALHFASQPYAVEMAALRHVPRWTCQTPMAIPPCGGPRLNRVGGRPAAPLAHARGESRPAQRRQREPAAIGRNHCKLRRQTVLCTVVQNCIGVQRNGPNSKRSVTLSCP